MMTMTMESLSAGDDVIVISMIIPPLLADDEKFFLVDFKVNSYYFEALKKKSSINPSFSMQTAFKV